MAVSTKRVIGAIYELSRRRGRWPTSGELADYLEEQPAAIAEHLRTLKRDKLFRDRRRDGRQVWMPWEAT